MRPTHWQFQNAKAQLSELVEAASRGEPQRITCGKDAVIVHSEKAYVALKSERENEVPNLIDHLLAMPRQRVARATDATEPREELKLRELSQ